MIDLELIPLAFVIIVSVIFLFIALYFNFIYREEVSEEILIDRMTIKIDDGRIDNTIIETINDGKEDINLTGKIKRINYKKFSTLKEMDKLHPLDNVIVGDSGVIYIVGPDNLSDKLTNGVLIQLDNDEIYTVNMPSCSRAGQSMNIWNASKSVKNLKSQTKFIVDGVEKTQMFTLKPEKIVSFQSNGKYWITLSPKDFSENKDMMLKYLLKKVELAIESNRLALDTQLGDTHCNLVDRLNDDKELYKTEVEKMMCAFEHDMNIKISSVDINSLSHQMLEKIKSKIDNIEIIMKHDILDIIKNESSKFNNKLNDMKEQVSQEVAYAIATDANDLKQKLTTHIEVNINIAREEVQSKINASIRNQQQSIIDRVENQIENVTSTKIKTAMLDMKEQLLMIINSKLKDEPIKVKLDVINQRIANVEAYFKTTIDSEILSLQQKMQNIIIDIKTNLISTINNKIGNITSQIESIKGELISMINNSRIQNKIEFQNTNSSLRSDIFSELENVKESFKTKLSETKESITNIVDDTHEYIDEQIVEVKTVITNQLNVLENELKAQRIYIDKKITSGEKSFSGLQTELSYLQSQILAMKNNINSSNITVDSLITSTIKTSSYINGWMMSSTYPCNLMNPGNNLFVGSDNNMNNSNKYNGNTGVGHFTFGSASMNIGNNTFFGMNGFANSVGDYNTGIGSQVSGMNSSYGTFVGYQSGFGINGKYNTIIGYESGISMTGDNNTVLGALASCSNFSYSTAIGTSAVATASNQIMLGGSNNGVYPTVVTPGPLSIRGGIQFQSIGGYIMTIDNNGQYSYNPMIATTPNIDQKDYYIIVNPGFKFIGFSDSNYSGSSYIIDNSSGFTMMMVSSKSLYGSNSLIKSYQIYYKQKLIDALFEK